MKKIFSVLIVSLFALSFFAQEFSEGTLESIVQKAKSEDKIVFLKFYSDTCSWCKKLDKEVLIPENLNKLSRLVVLYKINVKTDEGQLLREKYNIRGVPTVILLSGDGNEIDRIVGYEKKDDFLKELLPYIFNIGTLSQLTSTAEKEPSFDVFYKVASKYFERGDFSKSLEYINKAKSVTNLKEEETNNLSLLEGEVLLSKEPENGIKILTALLDKGNKEISETAFEDLSRYYKSKKDYDNLIAIYRKVLPNKRDDVSFLNSFAWTMAEVEKNLEEALDAAKKASVLSNEAPEILDTLAEVYYKMGDSDSAIKTIDKAISKEPNDDYFKRQREKFAEKNKKGNKK
jgi:thioredoxin-related protein